MNTGCPHSDCKAFKNPLFSRKDGHYFRRDDARKIQRFECKVCLKKYSASTATFEYRQKKRRVNHELFLLLSSSVSMRRSALILHINRTTVERKLRYLARKCRHLHLKFLEKKQSDQTKHLQFDDLTIITRTSICRRRRNKCLVRTSFAHLMKYTTLRSHDE